jgi:hypothetical protein
VGPCVGQEGEERCDSELMEEEGESCRGWERLSRGDWVALLQLGGLAGCTASGGGQE